MLPDARSSAVVVHDGVTVLEVMEKRHPARLLRRPLLVARAAGLSAPQIDWGTATDLSRTPTASARCCATAMSASFAKSEATRPIVSSARSTATHEGATGFSFAIWAPNARRVSVVGDFNNWDGRAHAMRLRHDGGIWELFIPDLKLGSRYKFEIISARAATCCR